MTLVIAWQQGVEIGLFVPAREPEERKIVLAKEMRPVLMLAVTVHELRHVEQFDVGVVQALALTSQ